MDKTLVLIRHGHRDTMDRVADNGLDEKGRDQAKFIKRYFTERFASYDLKGGLWFVASPKLRCRETILPMAKAMDREVDVHPDLDEQGTREGERGLHLRVERFLAEWRRSKIELTVVCSHGDWLPIAVLELLGIPQDFKKGAWLEVSTKDGIDQLVSYIPSFRLFYK